MSEDVERRRARVRKNYAANREKIRASRRAHYAANKEAYLERQRAYREAKGEELLLKSRAQRRAYYLANKEKERERQRAYNAANKEQISGQLRRYRLQRDYGLTLEQRDALFTAQGSKCAVCNSADPKTKKGWQVDHCHTSGKVRGILCQPCNTAIGKFEESVAILTRAIEYINKHTHGGNSLELSHRTKSRRKRDALHCTGCDV